MLGKLIFANILIIAFFGGLMFIIQNYSVQITSYLSQPDQDRGYNVALLIRKSKLWLIDAILLSILALIHTIIGWIFN